MREVYLYQTVHILDGECLCLREHLDVLDRWSRTLFGCPGPQDAREVGTAIAAVAGREAPGQRPFEIRAAHPAGIGLPAAGIRRRFALPRLRPAQPDARSRDAAIRTAAVRRPHLGTRGRRRAGTAIRRVAGCERRRTLRPQRDSHGGRRSGAVRHPGQAGLRPAGRSEHRAQPCSQEHPRRRAGTGRSAVGRDDLPRMDELFFIDHRGVTALSRCDGQPYMAIFAERIAGALRGLFPNM